MNAQGGHVELDGLARGGGYCSSRRNADRLIGSLQCIRIDGPGLTAWHERTVRLVRAIDETLAEEVQAGARGGMLELAAGQADNTPGPIDTPCGLANRISELTTLCRIIVESTVWLDVPQLDAKFGGNAGQFTKLRLDIPGHLACGRKGGSPPETLTIRVGRVRTGGNPVSHCQLEGPGHGPGITRVAAAGHIAGAHDLEELRIRGLSFPKVGIQIDDHSEPGATESLHLTLRPIVIQLEPLSAIHLAPNRELFWGRFMAVVLITGASSGIGAAAAIAFAEEGWDVMAAGRDEGRLAEVADVSDNIATWSGELTGSSDCEELISDTIDEFDALDCLVNSAGVLIRSDALETSDDDWRDTMTINLDIPFFLSRAAVPHLVKTEGSIVNISSYWGIQAGDRAAAYSTSKGGLIMLTKAMAKDHGRDGIRVNAVCPGGVDTPMLAQGAEDEDMDEDEFLEMVAKFSPNGRISTPEEVANLVLFLASDAALMINGAAVSIDGGLSA